MELHQHPFFRQLSEDEVGPLAAITQIRSFSAGDTIFEEGSPSDSLCLVLDGEVDFVKAIPGGEVRRISSARAGEFFGEVGLFTGSSRSLGAQAADDVETANIPKRDLLNFLKTHPEPFDQILQSVVKHLHETTRHYVDDMLRQEKMAMVGSMMNSVVHDFKNPFTLISLGAQLIAQIHDDERTRKLCRNIEDQIQRMLAMAEELAEFSRGQQQLRLAKVDLGELLNRFRELNFPFFQKDHIQIRLSSPRVLMMVEEAKLMRVLQNLVGNAIDALDDSGGSIDVTARIKDANWVEIIVSDDGDGIPEEIRAHFWDPFVTYGKSSGTGLGTAIVKSVIDAHGGEIAFKTAKGEGTTFTILLPRHRG